MCGFSLFMLVFSVICLYFIHTLGVCLVQSACLTCWLLSAAVLLSLVGTGGTWYGGIIRVGNDASMHIRYRRRDYSYISTMVAAL